MASQAKLVDNDAFSRLLEMHPEKHPYEMGGYLYLTVRESSGWVTYQTYGPKWRWLYSARRVATQGNAAGGAIIVDLQVATGMVAQLVSATMVNSGTNTAGVAIVDEDNADHCQFCGIASAAGTAGSAPRTFTATTTGLTVDGYMFTIAPGFKLCLRQSGAGAQNDTSTVAVSLFLPITADSSGSDITWSVARSTNAGNVTLAASTISAANTMQAVLLP